MAIFTQSVAQGMGLLAIVPSSVKKLRLKPRVCSSVQVRAIRGKEFNLFGTTLFSRTPFASDWFAVGNDLRLGFVKFLVGVGTNGEEEGEQSTEKAATDRTN